MRRLAAGDELSVLIIRAVSKDPLIKSQLLYGISSTDKDMRQT